MKKETFWSNSLRYLIGKTFAEFKMYGVQRMENYFEMTTEWPRFIQERDWYLRRVATFRTAALAFLWASRQLQPQIPRDVAVIIAKRMFAARIEFDQ